MLRAKDSFPIVQQHTTGAMQALIQNLQDQDVFYHPLFEAVRDNIGQANSIPTDLLRVLFKVWQSHPSAFFKPWSLQDGQPDRGGDHELPGATNDGDDSFTIYEPMARFAIHAIYVHDIILLGSHRRKTGSGLPRNLSVLIQQAWTTDFNEEASPSVISNLVEHVKAGNMCVRVGARIGEASWFLLPKSLPEFRWMGTAILPKF